tara:strand:+ start:239 stop:493 length:255 start_codon:yes stop_codon:yes gene_type:complete
VFFSFFQQDVTQALVEYIKDRYSNRHHSQYKDNELRHQSIAFDQRIEKKDGERKEESNRNCTGRVKYSLRQEEKLRRACEVAKV